MSVTEMLREMSGKRRWTIAEDYHPHIVSVSRYVHRNDPRFFQLDHRRQIDDDYLRGNTFRLPDLRKR